MDDVHCFRYSLPVPFEEDWSERERIVGVKVYVDMVSIAIVCGSVGPLFL